MTKQRRITRLTPATCEEIQACMLVACRKAAADHDLVIESAGWHGMDAGFAFEPAFHVSIPAFDGTAFNLEKDRFEFRTGNERFRITGIDPKRTRYPISVERVPDRRGFKFTAENVTMFLQAKGNKPWRSLIVPRVGQNRSFGPIRSIGRIRRG